MPLIAPASLKKAFVLIPPSHVHINLGRAELRYIQCSPNQATQCEKTKNA